MQLIYYTSLDWWVLWKREYLCLEPLLEIELSKWEIIDWFTLAGTDWYQVSYADVRSCLAASPCTTSEV